MIVPKLCKFLFDRRLGSSLLCPKSVLLQLEVIKCPTMGCDLAWCGGIFTHSGTDAQTDVRFRPTLKRHVCTSSEGGRVAHDVGG